MVGNRITDPGFSDSPDHGRGFRIAMLVIGGLLAIQLVVLALGLIGRSPNQIAQAPSSASVETAVPAKSQGPFLPRQLAAPPMREPQVEAPDLEGGEVVDPVSPVLPPTPLAGTPTLGPAFLGPAGETAEVGVAGAGPSLDSGSTGSGDLFARLLAASKSQTLEDLILERLLVTGVELRDSSNMQGALQAFREVESALPDHPRVLAEIGATLGKMGLKDKANGYWERVESLGAAGAGPYHPISEAVLSGGITETAPVPSATATLPPPAQNPATTTNPDQPMRIGEIQVEEEGASGEGQRVSLRIVIDADPALKPVADDFLLNVYFYDRLPSGEIRPSTADTSYLYPTEPYDWQVDGTEVIIVNYNQPVFTEAQTRELGERTFYGYAIELHYRDELIEKVAMPEEVGALRFEEAPGSGPAGPSGPENALFPNPALP